MRTVLPVPGDQSLGGRIPCGCWTCPACWASGLGASVCTGPGREDLVGVWGPRSWFWVGEAGLWSPPFSLLAPAPALSRPYVCRILLSADCQGRCSLSTQVLADKP